VNGGSGVIDGNTVSAYQKNGIVVTGSGTTASVTNNTVRGLGPVVFIAQNGIEVLPNPAGQNPEGFEYFATGLLLFEAGAGTKTSDNQFSGNQHNFANVP
jgi:hypothetical protein